MGKTAAIYARISETGKQRDKVADQIAQCRRLALRRGFEVVETFTDDGISALGGKDRPGFSALLDGILEHRFDVVLATEEERFARNIKDKADLQAACMDGGVVWETERDGYVDPSTEAGEFFSTMRAAMGRMESRRKAARQRANNSERAGEGRPVPGRRRYGYETDGVTPRESEAAIVRRMFQHVADGGSLRSLYRALQDEGVSPAPGKAWSAGRVRAILTNPHYSGNVRYKGATIPSAVVVPIVEEEFAANVRAILADPSRRTTPGPKPKYLLSGLVHCGVCGAYMRYMREYLCSKDLKHPHILGKRLEPLVLDEVAKALLTGGPNLFPTSEAGANIGSLVAAHQKNAEAVAAIVADRDEGLVPAAVARTRLIELKGARELIEAQLEKARTEKGAAGALLEIAQDLLDVVGPEFEMSDFAAMKERILDRFDALDFDRRREVIRALVYVEVDPGRDVRRVRVHHKLAHHLNREEQFDWDD